MQEYCYGFRIVGDCRQERRLVDWSKAFRAYCQCDERAEVSREAYLSAFMFGADFRRVLESTGSTRGYRGPCFAPWIWFDIDREDNLPLATKDTRRLAAFLVERYRLDDDDLLLFFSGSKGFHVGLPTSLFMPEPSDTFHRTARCFAERVSELVGIEIDVGVYDRVRAFRAPNSTHAKTGLHKRRFGYDELMSLRTSALVEFATKPMPFDPPPPPGRNDLAAADWREAAERVRGKTEAMTRRRANGNSSRLNRQTLDFIRDGAAQGDRHRLLFSCAANLAELDCPPALAHALLTEAGLDCGLPPSEVRRQIDCGLSSICADSTAQDGASAPQGKPDDSIIANRAERDTGASGASDGQVCQALPDATGLQDRLRELWHATPRGAD